MAAAALERLDREINGGRPPSPGAAAVRPLLEAAVGRWRRRADLAGGSLELRWRAGEAVVDGDRCGMLQALDNLVAQRARARRAADRRRRRPAATPAVRVAVRRLRHVPLRGSRGAALRLAARISGRRPPRPRPAGGAPDRRRPRRQLRPAPLGGRHRGGPRAAAARRGAGMSRRRRALAFLLAAALAAATAAAIADGYGEQRRPRLRRAAAGGRRRGDRWRPASRSTRAAERPGGAAGAGPLRPAGALRGAGRSARAGGRGADPAPAPTCSPRSCARRVATDALGGGAGRRPAARWRSRSAAPTR